MARYAEDRIAVSLPSLRVGTLTDELIDEIKKVRKTGFTLAPEAGSERMRRVINKGITEADLLETAYQCLQGRLASDQALFHDRPAGRNDRRCSPRSPNWPARSRTRPRARVTPGEVNVSVSTFVPKAHTPFQWEPQISHWTRSTESSISAAQELKKRKLNLKWQDAPLSFMEGVFARGDRRLGSGD